MNNDKCCKDLLDEIKKYNKIDIVVQGFQTKFIKDTKDSIKNIEETFEEIRSSFTGGFGGGGTNVIDVQDTSRPALSNILKPIVAQITQSIGSVFGSITGTRPNVPQQQQVRVDPFISSNYNNQSQILANKPEPYLDFNNQPTLTNGRIEPYIGLERPKSKFDSPNVIDSPSEKISVETKKQTFIFDGLLDVTEKSFAELKNIKTTLEGSSVEQLKATKELNKDLKASRLSATNVQPTNTDTLPSPLDLLGRGGAAGGKAAGGAAAGKAGAAGAAKAGFGAKALGALKTGGAMLGKGALVAGKAVAGAALAKPTLIAAGVSLAAYGAYKGYQAIKGSDKLAYLNDQTQRDVGASQATERLRAETEKRAQEAGVESFTPEYNDIEDQVRKEMVAADPKAFQMSEQKIGANVVSTESETASKSGVLQESDFQKGITSKKSVFGSETLGTFFSQKGQKTGQFLTTQGKTESFTGNPAELNLGSDLGVDYQKSKFTSLLGERISSGSIFKRDKYKVTDPESGTEIELSKKEYQQLENLASEGKAEEAMDLFNKIKASRQQLDSSENILSPYETMGQPPPTVVSKKQEQPRQASIGDAISRQEARIAGSIQSRQGMDVASTTIENQAMRDETTIGRGATQPVVVNNVNNSTAAPLAPIKGEPRPTHRGSALDRYSDRVAAY